LEGEGNHSISVSAHWFMQKNTPALHQLVGLGSQNRFLQSLYVSLFSARQHLFSTELKLRKKKLIVIFNNPACFQHASIFSVLEYSLHNESVLSTVGTIEKKITHLI